MWRTRKYVLGSLLDTLHLTIYFLMNRLDKFCTYLEAFFTHQKRTYWRKWALLIIILRSIASYLLCGGALLGYLTIDISVIRVRLHLTAAIHTELHEWWRLVEALSAQTTHLLKEVPHYLTFHGDHNALQKGPVGILLLLPSCPYFCRLPPPPLLQHCLSPYHAQ